MPVLSKEGSMEEGRLEDKYVTFLTNRVRLLSMREIKILFLQVRDEYRSDFDSGRGGYGKIIQQKVTPLSDGGFGR